MRFLILLIGAVLSVVLSAKVCYLILLIVFYERFVIFRTLKPIQKRNFDSLGQHEFIKRRSFDSLGNHEFIKRYFDTLGDHQFIKRGGFDSLGDHEFIKRYFDSLGIHIN